MNYIKAAFNKLCAGAIVPQRKFVSLYVDEQFYGGPEEGGWWGTDSRLVASFPVSSDEHAEAVKQQVESLAQQMSKDASDNYGRHCLRQSEWLDARGLDNNFLPEPDGPEKYRVVIEDESGSHERTASRHYE